MTDGTKRDIQFDVQVDPLPANIETLTAAAQAVLRRHRVRRAAVSITIVGDEQMRQYHRRFLKKTSTTDVISFDLTDEFETTRVFDLVVNADMASRQAQKRGHSAEAELALYLVHGLLHNLGYDDGTLQEAERMHRTEEAVLKRLGFDSVYYSRTQNTED